MIVLTLAYQLLPQLLMEQFDTTLSQCSHNGHMHEEVWFKKVFFTKLQLPVSDDFAQIWLHYILLKH